MCRQCLVAGKNDGEAGQAGCEDCDRHNLCIGLREVFGLTNHALTLDLFSTSPSGLYSIQIEQWNDSVSAFLTCRE